MHTLISVIICTHKRPNQLRNCVQSIIVQDPSPFELIIVYHSKNDLQKLNMLKKEMKVRFLVCNKTNSAAARNIAIKNAKGSILAFIDDDCVANKYWLQCITQQFKDPHCQMVMGKAVDGSRINIFSTMENARINHYVKSNIVSRSRKKYALVLDTKNFAVRKNLIKKHNLFFDTRFTNKFEDVDFGFRTILNGVNISYNPNIIVRHYGTSNFASHVRREIAIGYNYCVMKAKWENGFDSENIHRLQNTRTNIGFPPKSHFLCLRS